MADVTVGNTTVPGTGLGGATTAGQDWGAILGAILSGIGAFGTGPSSDLGRATTAAQMADPYMKQRSQWWPQIQSAMGGQQAGLANLNALTADPTSFLQSPMFTAPLKLGGESLARQYGAAGMGQSGNVGLAETAYGQSFADQYIQEQLNNLRANLGVGSTQLNQLMALGGVGAGSPVGAANAFLTGTGTQRQDLGSTAGGLGALLGSILGTPGNALGKILGLFGGGGGLTPGDPLANISSSDLPISSDLNLGMQPPVDWQMGLEDTAGGGIDFSNLSPDVFSFGP